MQENRTKKLIAIDLDGTLLTKGKTISPRTKRALQQAMADGHQVVIATGRPPRASMMYYEELGLMTPMINFNGALVHHAKDESWGQHHFPIELSTALQIIDNIEQFPIENLMLEIKDDYYLRHEDMEMTKFLAGNHPPLGIGNLRELAQDHPTSLLIKPHADTVHLLRSHLQEHHADVIEHRTWGVPWNVIEVCKAGVSKASGLELVANSLGIAREHVIAFGDEDNDLEMIEYAGLGVAMGNAIPELKAKANHVTDTNDNDGIALLLEKWL